MRKLEKVINATPSSDGDGVKIHRIAGHKVNALIDPFLMIDEMNSANSDDYMGGFPEHPHRGFELISYMKAGRLRHRDHLGNEGVLEAGDVQWMTAGKGVIHSEMPEQEGGLHHSFQIWLNLPSSEKMKAAAYYNLAADKISKQVLSSGGLITVIAGKITVENNLINGPLPELSTNPVFMDVQLNANESVDLVFNQDNPALVYAYEGYLHKPASSEFKNGNDKITPKQMAIFSKGETLQLKAGDTGAGLLIFSGRPLAEPIVQHGPFVMNTQKEIEQAIFDYQNNQLV